jgi:N-acetylglucosaminyldiphosphoundecaprenol N-acetyl-beta-D-mannosaminyltransferase
MRLISRYILGMRVDATSYEDAAHRVVQWAREGQSAYVCLAPVHMVMEAFDSKAFREVVNGAHMVAPDGKPLEWALKGLGVRCASQVRGRV